MIAALEIRETSLNGALVDGSGAILAREHVAAATAAAAAGLVRALQRHGSIERVGISARQPPDHLCTDIAAAVTGAVAISRPPRVVTHGSAVALAEHWLGSARGASHVAALTADECVHAGILVDGAPFEGAHGLAGSAGWLALNPVEREDYRRLGCLEAEAGASGIVRRIVWRIKSGDDSRVLDMAGDDFGTIAVGQIFEAAAEGDGVAISVVRDTARYLGMAVGNLIAVLDPEIVVLGGLMATYADLLLEPVTVEAARRIPGGLGDHVRIVRGELGDRAPLLGAARAAMLSA